MKHLILPVASSPHEGAHQAAPIVDLPCAIVLPVRFNPDVAAHVEFVQRHNWRLERELAAAREREEHQRWLERNAGADINLGSGADLFR